MPHRGGVPASCRSRSPHLRRGGDRQGLAAVFLGL